MKMAKIFWFTGLSGAGKTSVAEGSIQVIEQKGLSVLVLDGDDVRACFHCKLGFSEVDIKENNRLIARICQENMEQYHVILVPIISPFAESRHEARTLLGLNFFEVYCKSLIKTVEGRDIKGLYAKSRAGELDNLIGYSPGGAIYEPPVTPDIILDSDNNDLMVCIERFTQFVLNQVQLENVSV